MALGSIKIEPGLASHVTAFSGRCTSLPETTSTATTIHPIHGDEDPVIDLAHAVTAQGALISVGGNVALDIVEDLGHAIDNRGMRFALDHLRYTISKHYFDEALSGGKPGDDDMTKMM